MLNGEMVEFDELSLLEFDGVSVLQYGNTSKYSFIFNSGVSVTVEGQKELLGLVTLVPTAFKGTIVINLNEKIGFKVVTNVHSFLTIQIIGIKRDERFSFSRNFSAVAVGK